MAAESPGSGLRGQQGPLSRREGGGGGIDFTVAQNVGVKAVEISVTAGLSEYDHGFDLEQFGIPLVRVAALSIAPNGFPKVRKKLTGYRVYLMQVTLLSVLPKMTV